MTTLTWRLPRTFLSSPLTHQFPVFAIGRNASTAPQRKQPPSSSQKYVSTKQPPSHSAKTPPQLPYKARQPQTTTSKPLVHNEAPTSSTASLSSSPATPEETHPINAPLSTLPAPLSLPTRDPSTALVKHLFHTGKAYATFYKTGVKNIYTNYTLSRPIRTRLAESFKFDIPAAINADAITRQEYHLLRRSKHDLKRLPLFGLVFIVCGEFTPFIVLAMSSVVPWTCRIPKQIEKDRRLLEERRAISFSNLETTTAEDTPVSDLLRDQLLHVSWSLGLSNRIWDWVFPGQLPGLPTEILRRKVRARVEYLDIDDELIYRAGGVEYMSGEEAKMACVERGIKVLGRSEEDLRRHLKMWIYKREDVRAEYLLCTKWVKEKEFGYEV